jgi:hypothetical protein
VRTNFDSFEDEEECERDRASLISEGNQKINEIVNSCNGILYVNNPSLETNDPDEKELAKSDRLASREIVLDYLDKACVYDNYKLKE